MNAVTVSPSMDGAVTRVFTFGYGHTDPVTAEPLDDACAVIMASTAERCRQLMNQNFGHQWASEYPSLDDATNPGYGLRIHIVIDEMVTVERPSARFFRKPSASQWIDAFDGEQVSA